MFRLEKRLSLSVEEFVRGSVRMILKIISVLENVVCSQLCICVGLRVLLNFLF
jgi:hypothetical protein